MDDLYTATVVFHLENGRHLTFDHVAVETIGPSAENPGVVGVEFTDDADRIVHVPFVLWWEVVWH